MTKTLSDIAAIVRKVTGRTDQSISNSTIFTYVNDFYQLEMSQDIRLFEDQSYYEFSTEDGTDEYAIDMDSVGGSGYSIFTEPVYVGGYRINFYTDPKIFFAKWPETQTYTEQRPVDVLWYNNTLVFRSIPDDAYEVKMSAYKINTAISESSDVISEDYLWRYIAYGASLDILADGGEFEKYAQVMPIYERYKATVNARTYTQHKDRKVIRNF